MGNGSVAGAIIMAICCFGCAALFYAIGAWAAKARKPVSFWSGIKVDADKVKDIPAYNRANAVMWKVYSIPYWTCGIFGSLGFLGDVFTIVSAVILFLACVPGLILLVRRYHKIEKLYVMK